MSDPTHTHDPGADPFATTALGTVTGSVAEVVSPQGFELLNEIGQGGMGVVYRARERQFDRFVAIKVLHTRYTSNSTSARRFLDEARITAQLQHPGIPPVHHVGELPDGRPFLAMKLIEGDSLDRHLANRPPDRLEVSRWLGVIEGVCQAVGYAHANRVIHRDLKPANIMVGAFGEVQVMDWGLAKKLTSTSNAEPEFRDTTESTDTELTQSGSILGTPAYMPPEQARGETDTLDARSDVYSLGAMLCELLTGQSPLADSTKSVRTLIERLAAGDLAETMERLDRCGGEAELIALTKRCLAAAPSDRPADAQEVAAALAAHRAGVEQRLRVAEVDRAKVEEQERRQRMKVRFLAGISFLILMVWGLVFWVYESSRQFREQRVKQEREVARSTSAATAEVQLLQAQGLKQVDDPTKWQQTLSLARVTLLTVIDRFPKEFHDQTLLQPLYAAQRVLDQDTADCELLIELDRLPELNEIGLYSGIPVTNTIPNRYAAAFRKVGFDLDTMSDDEILAWLREHRFRERITLALRDWVSAMPFEVQAVEPSFGDEFAAVIGVICQRPQPPESRQDRLRRLVDAVSDSFTQQWWQAVQARNWDQTLQKLMARPEYAKLTSRQMASFADGFRFSADPQLRLDFLKRAYLRFPAEFWVNYRLTKFYQDYPQWKVPGGTAVGEALRHATAAVAAKPTSAFPRVVLALRMMDARQDPRLAEEHLKNATAVDPTSPWPHLVLGGLAATRDRWDEAIDRFMAGVRADPDIGLALVNAFTLPIQAPNTSRMAELFDRLVAEYPDRPEPWLLRAERRANGGGLRGQLADLREAEVRLPRDHPKRVVVEMSLANLTKLAAWERRLPEALAGGSVPTPTEWADAARYCAEFDKNYAKAVECAERAMTQQSATMKSTLYVVAQYAEWALKASDEKGLNDDERTRFRRLALSWLTECAERQAKPFEAQQWNVFIQLKPAFRRYTNPMELKKQPPDEQAAWELFLTKAGRGKPR